VEVVLGVQFDRLKGFHNAHLGAFWKTLDQEEWPKVQDAPPLPPKFEQFGEGANWSSGLQFQLTSDQASRMQITDAVRSRMIQVQNCRLHFNWLGEAGGAYPRYDAVRVQFRDVLDRFLRFLDAGGVGPWRPNQWEITYVNHIPKGTLWETAADWTFFRPLAGVPNVEGIIEGDGFGGVWKFAIPGQKGRLHIHWQQATASKPAKAEIVRLTLTARGPVDTKNAGIIEILAGLDLGHATVVGSFSRLMSDEANRHWGIKHADS